MRKQFLFSGILAGTVLMYLPAAQATPTLDFKIISGGASAECNGCTTGPGILSGGATGTFTVLSSGNVLFVGAVGSSTVNVSTALGASFLATPQISVNNAETISSGGPVTIEATDYGQTLTAPASISSNFSTSIDANGPATGTFETFYSTSNALFGGTSLTGGPQTITGALNQTYGIDGVIPAAAGTLSDSIIVSLDQPAGNSFGFTSSITVPEPLTLAMFGSGLIGLGGMLRRRKKS